MPTILGRMLLDAGVIDEARLAAALDAQRVSRERLGEILVTQGADADAVYRALAAQLRLPYAPAPLVASAAAVRAVSHALARRHRALPLTVSDRRLEVAMADPLDLAALDELQFQTGRRAEPHVAIPAVVDAAIAATYERGRVDEALERIGSARRASRGAETDEVRELRRAADAKPIITLVDLLFERCVDLGASDLHLEPDGETLRCRARVDGYLRELQRLPLHVAGAVASRIKVMAGLDIALRRRPQDGRATIRVGDRTLGLRVSTLPTVAGEKVVVRLLDPVNAAYTLERLGMSAELSARIERLLRRRHGAILVTGPTGSGKTTTLYAMIGTIDRERLNVVTLEDPVEYRLSGLAQVQVHTRAGLTFATALRSVLRQDPDVVLVGEMRDRETVEVGMAAALTGHLVLSTLHTVDAPGAVARLLDMGAPPYLVAGGLTAVLAQRVVRRVGARCRGEHQSEPCAECGGAGFRGRVGVFELMEMTESVTDLVMRRASAADLRRAALRDGMVPMDDDARAKIAAGVTTMLEAGVPA